MSKLLRAFIFLALILSASDAFAQNTYYISKSLGSDSNSSTQAQSKLTPWQHVPGMAGATGNANSYSPVPGDQFILYGGDTWGTSDLPLATKGAGTGQCVNTPNSSCIYVGVDQTWYNSGVCGSSWCRPIFSQQNTVESWYAMVYVQGSYYTLDNIELTGLLTSGGGTSRMVGTNGGAGNVIEHCYFHGWNHSASGDADNSVVITMGGGANTIVHDTVIDGADTLAATAVSGNPCGASGAGDLAPGVCQGMMIAVQSTSQIYNCVIKNVSSGQNGSGDFIYNTWLGPIWLGYTGGHRNGVQIAGSISQSYELFYNNVVTQIQDGGMGGIWLEQGTISNSTPNPLPSYMFDNVMFNTSGEGLDLCQLGTYCGPFYIFNNSLQCGTDSNQAGHCNNTSYVGSGAVTYTENLINDHCIVTGGDCATSNPVPSGSKITLVETTNLSQSVATANGQGYWSTSTYALQPTKSNGGTVGTGTNEQSLCTTINALNSTAGTACLSATGYACTYNTTNHTVSCPTLPLVPRPSADAPDIGAYQFSSSGAQAPPPQAPTNLQVTVQ